MKIKLLVLGILFIARSVLAADKFSVSNCVQDVQSEQTLQRIGGMVLSPPPTLGLVTVYFKGDFIATNNTGKRRGTGGTIRLLRDGVELERSQIYFPVNRHESIFLPLSLHVFDYPNSSVYTYSVDWASDSTNNVSMRVNCRSLTAILE